MISSDGHLRIADFGFAKFYDPNEGGLTETLGSPLYMAPEIIKGDRYKEKVDIWSTGIICFMLLTGVKPFPGANKEDTKTMII